MSKRKNILFSLIITVMLSASIFGGLSVIEVNAAERPYSMEEMLAPVWMGTQSYNESVLAVEEEDGSIAPIDLLYPIEEIVSVKNASLNKTYTAGVDYEVQNGKFAVKKSGSIPRLTYSEFHPTTGTAGFEARDGGYVLWQEGAWFHLKQVVVTYKHAESYSGYIPEGKGRLLERTLAKLEDDATDSINMLVYGDSISTGGNSSGHPDINVAPYMPIYPKLFANGIKQKYGVNVNVINESVGGTDSAWALKNLRDIVTAKYEDFDLIVLAFGMNDITVPPENYGYNIKRMVRSLKAKYETADILLVAPMLPNYDAVKYYGYQSEFYGELEKLEEQGLAAVNVTGVHKGILETKRYADMTGNNVNHANDYLARIYAQTLLKTLEVSDYGKPEEPEKPNPDDDIDPIDPAPGGNDPINPDPGENTGNENQSGGKKKSGCNGSVAGTSVTLGILLAAASVCAIHIKKSKHNK